MKIDRSETYDLHIEPMQYTDKSGKNALVKWFRVNVFHPVDDEPLSISVSAYGSPLTKGGKPDLRKGDGVIYWADGGWMRNAVKTLVDSNDELRDLAKVLRE